MAKFQYYNIQVLPLNVNTHGFIGKDGYDFIFKELKELSDKNYAVRRLHIDAYKLPQSIFYLATYALRLKLNYVTGKFLKFDRPDQIQNLYTTAVTYTVKKEESVYRHEIYFMFDSKSHVMAIDASQGRLPSVDRVIVFLETTLSPVVKRLFPDYLLTTNVLASAQDLETVLESATAYKRVEADVTYSNASLFSQKLLREIDNEHKENQITSIVHVEKSARDSVMLAPTKYAKALLKLATSLGRASIRYLNAEHKWQNYESADSPVSEQVNKIKTETQEQYEGKVYESIKRAKLKALPSEES